MGRDEEREGKIWKKEMNKENRLIKRKKN